MVEWWQFWNGYWTSYRQPEDAFSELIAPPGWKRLRLMRCFNRVVYFVYPGRRDFATMSKDRLL